MKVLSAVRYSGKTHWSHKLGYADCDVIVSEAIGWPKHFDKKENIKDTQDFVCEETDEPISLSRLEARPIATLSIEAQERHERMERTHRDD